MARQLLLALKTNRAYLEQMKDNEFTPGIAWTTRNILELAVWTKYCLQAESNAKRFFQDAARDAIDMMHMPDEIIKEDLRGVHRAERDRLIAQAAIDGIASPKSYVKVVDAAATVDYPHFKALNKLLSKWAHPTAFGVLAREYGKVLNTLFYDLGSRWATEATVHIQQYFASGLEETESH